MKKIFCSGSCRVMTTINTGRNKIDPIHSMITNFYGINFLGKLHNTKQHIQFLKWIKDEIDIPYNILEKFLTSYSRCSGGKHDPIDTLPIKKKNIQNEFENCDVYIFEICSIKLYKKEGYEVQNELTTDYDIIKQTKDELLENLNQIRSMISDSKKIIFQTHFRPNIIYNKELFRLKLYVEFENGKSKNFYINNNALINKCYVKNLKDFIIDRIEYSDAVYVIIKNKKTSIKIKISYNLKTKIKNYSLLLDENIAITNREIIYETVNDFCEKNRNTFIYDPSVLIANDKTLFDNENHWTDVGHIKSFNYIYNNFIIDENTNKT